MNQRKLLTVLVLATGISLTGLGLTRLHASESNAAKPRPMIDLAFCIDTTGSMQNELEAVKTKTKEIVAALAASKPSPRIRVGVVAFRDRGDDYVTKVFPFTEDIDKVVKDISDLTAAGGGDEPEAVNEALHAAVHQLSWSTEPKAAKQLFLIGDAGPNTYPDDYDWQTECKQAISQGIQINTIACDGLRGDHLAIFGKIAKLTDGTAEQLTYKQEIVDSAGKKATVVTYGGARYEVGAADESWREGAGVLSAKGAASRVETESRGKARRTAMPAAAFSAAGAPAMFAAVDSAYAEEGAARPASRRDSNLADIVLKKTKAALEKSSSARE